MISPHPTYNRAPIIEAVIEIRFEEAVSPDKSAAAVKLLKENYFFEEQEVQVQAAFDAASSTLNQHVQESPRLVTLDRADIVVLRPLGLLVSRLAPYPGWETFYTRIRRDYAALQKATGNRRWSRVGLRFINRFDVPQDQWIGRPVSDFVGVYPTMPRLGEESMDTAGFTAQVEVALDKDGTKVRITSAQVEPPVPNTGAFILDIDVIRDVELPRREDHLWTMVERMREHKNHVFEKCLTPFSRELIS